MGKSCDARSPARAPHAHTATMSSSKANQSDAEEESDGSGSDGEEASWCVHTHTFFSPLSVVRAGTALDTF